MPSLVSVVIPVRSDGEDLGDLLETLSQTANGDVTVVQADGPAGPASRLGHPHVQWLSSAPGRGRQMNIGARQTDGRWLLFLHADTRLPPGWQEEIRHADRDARFVAGSFRFALDSSDRRARVIERGVGWRVRWLKLPYGDQGLFVRRSAFEALGGYREVPLMEDVDLVIRLRRLGALYFSELPAATSPRRWEQDGWFRRSAMNTALVALFLLGVTPNLLARWYQGTREHAPSKRGHDPARPDDPSGGRRPP